MARILIILDGSDPSASIPPIAFRYAAPGDALVLACTLQPVDLLGDPEEVNGHPLDLKAEMEILRKSGISVRAELLPADDLTAAIDKAAERFQSDVVALISRSAVQVMPALARANAS
jgi:hypothetical protein